eukprot:2755659-Pleurochrysis_carterae.AAC.1
MRIWQKLHPVRHLVDYARMHRRLYTHSDQVPATRVECAERGLAKYSSAATAVPNLLCTHPECLRERWHVNQRLRLTAPCYPLVPLPHKGQRRPA